MSRIKPQSILLIITSAAVGAIIAIFLTGKVQFVSTEPTISYFIEVTTTVLTVGAAMGAAYWAHHLRDQVRLKKEDEEVRARLKDISMDLRFRAAAAAVLDLIYQRFQSSRRVPRSVYIAAVETMLKETHVLETHIERVWVLNWYAATKLRHAYIRMEVAGSAAQKAHQFGTEPHLKQFHFCDSPSWKLCRKQVRGAIEAYLEARVAIEQALEQRVDHIEAKQQLYDEAQDALRAGFEVHEMMAEA